MKIKEIYIKDFRQFKDFTLDLTYPKGHVREGQALEKVCFIGQSGTGKTSLLKLIYLIKRPIEYYEKLNCTPEDLIKKVAFKIANNNGDEMKTTFRDHFADQYPSIGNLITVFHSPENNYTTLLSDNFENETLNDNYSIRNFLADGEYEKKSKLIYFPSNLKYDISSDFEIKNGIKSVNNNLFDFNDTVRNLWSIILDDVTKYHEQILSFRQSISIAAENEDKDAVKNEVAKLKEWEASHFNPINDIADKCIDPLVKNFSLKVKRDLNIQQKEDIGFIKLETLESTEVQFNTWSTGTKQVIWSALPLYKLQPKNSTILFDEPETSLYPDLQRIIINYYQGFTEDSQFFYATHSPIIASSFEPWEIVELKFDTIGNVERERYYEGENHVDNYYIDPRFLNFDLMLKEVFDMKFTNGDMRYEALGEYKMLKNQLETLKKEDKLQTEQARVIYKRFKSLSKKLVVNPTADA